jgi:hypothetical protein
MRVEEPMLSMVATLRTRRGVRRAIAPNDRQAPLNSSIPAMRRKISGLIDTPIMPKRHGLARALRACRSHQLRAAVVSPPGRMSKFVR